MPKIEQLSASVVNKIAAGEVIERPASVVKELLENAVDAAATRIDVAVQQGGSQLIRVADNGQGIPPDELPLAVASHATSKIRTAEDLFSVGTLGFRGEALASIAEISRLAIRSRTSESAAGTELEVLGGHAQQAAPCGCPVGTVIEVRDLFYNTPVRKKFMRTTQTEMGHASEAFTRLAIAFPQIQFTLRHNTRTLHELPPTEDWRERIARFFGQELADTLIHVDDEHRGVRLSGYVANPTHSRSNNRMQYLLLNGRHIRDRALQHALGEAYRGLLMTGRFPICFLRLDMPPDLVDVNVHPTKLEVRFQDAGQLYSQLLGVLRTRFLSTDLTARLKPDGAHNSVPGAPAPHDEQQDEAARRELVDWAKQALAQRGGAIATSTTETPSSADPQIEFALPPPRAPLALNRIDLTRPASESTLEDDAGRNDDSPAADRNVSPADHSISHRPTAIQIHNRYLVAESDEGVVVIDQHALHERILYEQLRETVLAGAIQSQKLLVPEPVDLSPEEAAVVLDQHELLAQLGLTVEPFGGDTVLVSSYPAILAGLSPAELLRDLAGQLLAEGKAPEGRDLFDSVLHMISCKAAIKAGDRLSMEEVSTLIEQRHLAQDAHHCPHGRPTALVFTRDELDRQFKRV